jgi:hypothetical protein
VGVFSLHEVREKGRGVKTNARAKKQAIILLTGSFSPFISKRDFLSEKCGKLSIIFYTIYVNCL